MRLRGGRRGPAAHQPNGARHGCAAAAVAKLPRRRWHRQPTQTPAARCPLLRNRPAAAATLRCACVPRQGASDDGCGCRPRQQRLCGGQRSSSLSAKRGPSSDSPIRNGLSNFACTACWWKGSVGPRGLLGRQASQLRCTRPPSQGSRAASSAVHSVDRLGGICPQERACALCVTTRLPLCPYPVRGAVPAHG